MNEYDQKDSLGGSPPDGDRNRPQESTPESADSSGSGQYWSGQDSRRASAPHGQHGAYRPQESGESQGYPYQYNANTGWQSSSTPNPEWNFQSYDNMDPGNKGGKNRKKNKHGVMVVAVAVLCVLSVALIALSGVSIYYSIVGEPEEDVAASSQIAEGEEGQEGEPGTSVDNEGQPESNGTAEMELNGKPDVPDVVSSDGRLTIPQVAQRLLPSVVSVENYMGGEFYEPAGLGSGIIMSDEGYIVTNQHVVAESSALRVTLNTGENFEAVVVGQDSRTDLAVIKIDPGDIDLISAEFGDSAELQVGETVIAVGNPASLELAGSVTRGIVSALNRQMISSSDAMTYIQTDAAINPGNSGGALANEFGQVIGINTSKIVSTGFEGIGFAIPISEAKPIIDDLLSNGHVTGRVKLGITAKTVDEIAAKNYGLPMGLMIHEIEQTADIAQKGVQVRDIITHIDGTRIYTFEELRTELDGRKVGELVKLTLYRQSGVTKGDTFDVSVALMEDVG